MSRPLLRPVCLAWLTTVVFGFAAIAHAAVVVRDDSGRAVALDRPAARIVSLAPHVTELFYAIGAGNRLVGATGFSDYPPAAKALPKVGGLYGLDVERIVALKPDLVVAWRSGTSEAELDQLERIGLVVFRSEPHTLDDIATTMARFGVLTGDERLANEAAAGFRAQADTLRRTYESRSPVRVFYQVWNEPLMTVGGPQLITQVIELCGGRNVFASLSMLSPVVDAEAVIAADPQLIVTSAENADHARDIATWSRWGGVSAVRAKRFLFVDPALITRHTPRVLLGAEQLCRAIDEVRRLEAIQSRDDDVTRRRVQPPAR